MNKKTSSVKKYITQTPGIMGGTPVIAGTRVPMARILFLLKEGYTVDLISDEYPHVGKKKLEAAIDELISKYQTSSNVFPTL